MAAGSAEEDHQENSDEADARDDERRLVEKVAEREAIVEDPSLVQRSNAIVLELCLQCPFY